MRKINRISAPALDLQYHAACLLPHQRVVPFRHLRHIIHSSSGSLYITIIRRISCRASQLNAFLHRLVQPFQTSLLTSRSTSAEQELHVFWCQFVQSNLIVVDSSIDHVCLLFLKQDHSWLDWIFNDEPCDNTRPTLANTMATICWLPLRSWVPPSVKH